MSDFLQRQRDAWKKTYTLKDRPFIVERPPVFSPAAAVQAEGNGSGMLYNWIPIWLPAEYTHWVEESLSYVETAYIGDWSALDKVRIKGPDALNFLRWVGMNSLRDFKIGRIKHHVQLNQDGKVCSEGVVIRESEDSFMYTGGGGNWTGYMFNRGKWDAVIEWVSADYYIFAVQGPKSFYILEKLIGESLRDIGFNQSRMARINGNSIRVLRTGITGELGYELHGSAEDANAVWKAVVAAGAAFGIRQLGMRAQIISHVEAGIATNGLDYLPASIGTPGGPKLLPGGGLRGSYIPENGPADFFRSPGELGWGGRGPLDGHDFVGKEALLAERDAGGPPRRFVGLTWNSDDVVDTFAALFGNEALPSPMELPRTLGPEYDQVLHDGTLVGCSTSRVFSSNLRKMISFAVLDRDLAVPGTPVTVVWGFPGSVQRNIRATVTGLPFKKDRRRTDVTQL